MSTHRSHFFRATMLGALLPLALCSSAHAFQGGCPEPDLIQVWVDPFRGSDAVGMASVNDPTMPWATLNAAIAFVDGQTGPFGPLAPAGLVHALPGLYTNDVGINPITPQTFPVQMRPNVHVQGAGAKECVLRVRPAAGAFGFAVYWPLSTGLVRRPGTTIAVDFTVQTNIEEPSMFDGFTIQGADVQVYAETELGPRSGRVSNCVFDMRHEGDELVPGPFFGALIAAIYFGEDGIDYHEMPFFLFNNTFLQGVRHSEEEAGVELSREDSVAICNVNDPAPPCGLPICYEDPDLTIRGVSDLHIQNNLIRCLDDFPRTAMLGIGSDDTQVIVSSRLGVYDSNAFDAAQVGGTSIPAGLFSSAIPVDPASGAPLTPVPAVDLTLPDPGFVGEFLSATSAAALRIRDARLLPDSVLLDMGASPAWVAGACEADFTAGNGLNHVDVTRASPLSSFDFDGDGHGNPRIVGEDVDIGMDEIDWVVQAGNFGNDTKSHHLPYDPALGVDSLGVPLIQTGTANRDYIFGAPTTFWHLSQMSGFNPAVAAVWTVTGVWTHMPGTVAFETTEIAPGTPLPIPVAIWIDFLGLFTGLPLLPAQLVGSFGTTTVPFTNLESLQVHDPDVFRWTLDETVTPIAPTHFSQELLFLDPVLGFLTSNLQAEYL